VLHCVLEGRALSISLCCATTEKYLCRVQSAQTLERGEKAEHFMEAVTSTHVLKNHAFCSCYLEKRKRATMWQEKI
jgi:hypothetical protein